MKQEEPDSMYLVYVIDSRERRVSMPDRMSEKEADIARVKRFVWKRRRRRRRRRRRDQPCKRNAF